jgi:hypothetical protein
VLPLQKKVTAHAAPPAVTARADEPRILVQAPIVEQPEMVSETIVEPEQEQVEAPPAEVRQQEAPAPHKKGFWSKLNPFKKRKSEQTH